MSLARRVTPHLIATLTSERTRDARRWLAERRRRLRREPHRVLYFRQVDDPYSHLAAQVLPAFAGRYDVELAPLLVGPPSDAAAPARAKLAAHARKDAADVAPYYGLAFRDPGREPDAELVQCATNILAAVPAASFAEPAVRAGHALWSGDRVGLDVLAKEHTPARDVAARAAVERGCGAARCPPVARRPGAPRPATGVRRRSAPARRAAPRARVLRLPAQPLHLRRHGARLRPPPALPARADPAPRAPDGDAGATRAPGEAPLHRARHQARGAGPRRPLRPRLRPRRTPGRARPLALPLGSRARQGRRVSALLRARSLRRGHRHGDERRPAAGRGADGPALVRGRASPRRAGLARRDRGEPRGALEPGALGRAELPPPRAGRRVRLLGRDGELDFCTWGQDRPWRIEAEIRRRLG